MSEWGADVVADDGWGQEGAQDMWEEGSKVAEAPVGYATEIKLFGKWNYDVFVKDLSLESYITLKPVFLPHSAGRYQQRRFRKAACPIVERLVNALMRHGRNNGKKLMAVRIVKHTFDLINLMTGENPIQVLVNAVQNAGPREDTTRIGSAGVVRRQSVDVSPLRRVNLALYLISVGARERSFRSIKSISECLAEEIISCAEDDGVKSYAIRKKDEIERVATANR